MFNLTNTLSLSFCSRAIQWVLWGVSTWVLSGCQAMGGGTIPASEYVDFIAKPPELRQMNQVSLRWEIRDDVAQYCSQSIGMLKPQANLTPPIACAVWQVKTKECVIVTGRQTSHVALGHEIRHCFEGHFHNKSPQS